jgi:low temperature requirement protein LtrA
MANAASQVLTHEDGRKATWFELFFDLVFVVSVAALAGALSHHYDWKGFAEFGFLFLVLWWLWLGHIHRGGAVEDARGVLSYRIDRAGRGASRRT